MATRIDSRQAVNRTALANLKTVGNEELDNVFGILDKWMGRPFDISLTGAVITLGASAVQYVKSDGADSTANVQKGGISPISKQYLSFASSTITVSSGAVTGDFATSPQAATVPANQYVWLGFYALADNKIYTTFGLPNAVKANATYPAFPGRPIGMIELQDNGAGSGGSTWNFSSPVVTDAIMFLGGGGGGDGSGSGLGSNLPDLPYLMEWEDSFPDDTLVNKASGYTNAQLDVAASAYKLSYESKTQASWGIAGASTAITTTSAPAFTVKAGDVITAIYNGATGTAGAGLTLNLLTATTSIFTAAMINRMIRNTTDVDSAYIVSYVSGTQVYVDRDVSGWSGDALAIDSKPSVRKIYTAPTQMSFTIEGSFPANLNTCVYACFSQCVSTTNLTTYYDSSDAESISAARAVNSIVLGNVSGGITDTVSYRNYARVPLAGDIILAQGSSLIQTTVTSVTDAISMILADTTGMSGSDKFACITPQQQYLVHYTDDGIGSGVTIGYQAITGINSSGNWAAEYGRTRQNNVEMINQEQTLDTPANAGARFFLRFFVNSLQGAASGTKSFYGYQAWWYREAINAQSGICQQAYGMTSNIGSTNNVNMTISVVGGKTRITLPWSYVVSANPGKPYGELEVRLNAQELPRYTNATITPGAYYTEVSSLVIDLDQDYSTYAFEIGVVVRYGTADSSNDNASKLSIAYNCIVGTTAGCTHSTLAAAIAACPVGGRILVNNETFTITGALATVNKDNITIEGKGRGSLFDGDDTGVGITISNPGCVIRNIKLKDFTTAIDVNANYCMIVQNWYESNTLDVDTAGATFYVVDPNISE